MVPLSTLAATPFGRSLAKYDPRATVARAAGLLTAPNLQANNLRVELLVHLAVAHCSGRKRPGHKELSDWLDNGLGRGYIAHLEDPAEDVFISNVVAGGRNYRIFEGTWESSDYHLQAALDAYSQISHSVKGEALFPNTIALLKLSDCVAERSGLQRWASELSTPKGKVRVTGDTRVEERGRNVCFSDADLQGLGISVEELAPFTLTEGQRVNLAKEQLYGTSLERHPLVESNGELILALPTAVSPAIRLHLIETAARNGLLSRFAIALAELQARQVYEDGLLELRSQVESLPLSETADRTLPALHSRLFRYDVDKYLHVVLLHDYLPALLREGLAGHFQYPDELNEGLQSYLQETARSTIEMAERAEGTTLLLLGGLGRGAALGFKEWPPNWNLAVLSVPDLLTLSTESGRPLTRFLKCIKQRAWAEDQGVNFSNVSGDFNFYCFWHENNFQVVPQNLPVGPHSLVGLLNDFVEPVREKSRKLRDDHALADPLGATWTVTRYGRGELFGTLQERPIYASSEHIRAGILAAVIETACGETWLFADGERHRPELRHLLYHLWSGFIVLLDRLNSVIESRYGNLRKGPVGIQLQCSALKLPQQLDPRSAADITYDAVVSLLPSGDEALITLPELFLENFVRVENRGERAFLRALARAIALLRIGQNSAFDASTAEALADEILADAGIRIVHMFQTYSAVEHLLGTSSKEPHFLDEADSGFARIGLMETCVPAGTTDVMGKVPCCQALQKVVDKVLARVTRSLRVFDRTSVVLKALESNEAILADRDHWRRTAQAVLAIYGHDKALEASRSREQRRNAAAMASRTLLEIAVCECAEAGGRQLSDADFDGLLADTALLYDVASDSDAIYGNLTEPRVRAFANGDYGVRRDFHEEVIRPFVQNRFQDEYLAAAQTYGQLYERVQLDFRERAAPKLTPEFVQAFSAEYGLDPEQFMDGFAELLDFALEQSTVVVQSTVGEIAARLVRNRGYSEDAARAFLDAFCLFSRPVWADPPPGFRRKDIEPWKFRRRLSLIARPVLAWGRGEAAVATFGVGMVSESFRYIIGRAESGRLPQEFFTSEAMRSYAGCAANRRGHTFAEDVAARFRELGWDAVTRVEMSSLGAPSAYGDIDVLAWRHSGVTWVVECKWLQPANTVGEIADVLKQFAGEAKDDLGKHVRRIEWAKAHPASLSRICRLPAIQAMVRSLLVTNTDVPMMYMGSLPISARDIVPLVRLAARLDADLG